MKAIITSLSLVILLGVAGVAEAGSKGAALRGGEFQKPLEVKGQTRNISMMLVNQSSKNEVKFVTARKNFREQILSTKY